MKRYLPILLSLLMLAAPAAAGATTFGADVNAEFVYQARGVWSPTLVTNSLKALNRAGGRVARADSDWAGTEPRAPRHGRHLYNWGYDDMIVSELAAAHVRWEPTLAFAPRWAQGGQPNVLHLSGGRGRVVAFLPPASNATFATYATAFMQRYGAHGAFWKAHRSLPQMAVTNVEVWNEPDNLYDWGQHIDLGAYARMYETVRTAIRRVAPQTRVVTGGLAWTESSLPRLLRAFRGLPMDALAIHPYGATPAQTLQVTRDALTDLRLYGRGGTPVLANEYGWTSVRHTWGSTPARHIKRYAYEALVGLAHLHLSEIEPFSWGDASWGLSTGSFAQAVATVTHHRVSHAKASGRSAHRG